jgi:hypothetical protein
MAPRKAKVSKAPTKLERFDELNRLIVRLPEVLVEAGFGELLQLPKPVELIYPPISDSKTKGWIGHVEEPLSCYIQRVSVEENFSQRPPFDHVTDPIYKRLIRDFIDGAVMPEAKVAALSRTAEDRRAKSLEQDDIYYSVIDGLQRLYCYCIAILLVLYREKLVQERCIPKDSWEYFEEYVTEKGTSGVAIKEILSRKTRYEIFYGINLTGLLHYMVTFNTGQRRMSLPVQLEIMRRPLIQELENIAKNFIYHEMQKSPGGQKPKDKFAASDLVLATEAFLSNNPQVSATKEAERFLDKSQTYLENAGDITDPVRALKFITTKLHPKIMQVYADNASHRYILSSGNVFLIGLIAACGYVRNRSSMKTLEVALDKLLTELESSVEDPLMLAEYQSACDMITGGRGRNIRRLVYETFNRFFMGYSTRLEWMDTAKMILGSSS